MPIHIQAERSDLAPVALLVGDPGRAERIADLLANSRRYNAFRGLLGYTGELDGGPLSVQTTGMGGPSAAIVVEELAELGVETVIRLGTCGAIADRVGVLDLVVATASVPMDGTTRQYVSGEPYAPVGDLQVTSALNDAARAVSRPVHVGLCLTEDAFYRQPEGWDKWRARGVIAVEMEASTIFTVALHRGLRAGAAFLAVDRVGERDTWAPERSIAEASSDLIALGFEAVRRLRA